MWGIQSKLAILTVMALTSIVAAKDYNLSPTQYSMSEDANRVSSLESELPTLFQQSDPQQCLKLLLAHLNVSEHSQVLVFSKSSEQNRYISPRSPRAIYFSEDFYLGYVPGGMMELIAADDPVGLKFYTFDPRVKHDERKVRRDNSCLRCHANARTRDVPGVLVRSLSTESDGHLDLLGDTYLTKPSSPIEQRWGGWYVTGRHGDSVHMGNQFSDLGQAAEKAMNLDSLEGIVDLSGYLQTTSDIVSLMVLEHQVAIHNLLSAVRMELARAEFLTLALDPEQDLRSNLQILSLERDYADKLLAAMMFVGEAPLPADGIDGNPSFAESFEARGPRSEEGWSLYDLRLQKRMFKYRCSYMIYSKAFEFLPAPVKRLFFEKLQQHLEGEGLEGLPSMSAREKSRVHAILAQTHPGYQAFLASSNE